MPKSRLLPVVFAAALSVLCAAVARNAQDDRRDGNWWIGLDKAQKVNYMVGFFDGMRLGRDFSYWGILDKDKDDPAVGKVAGSFNDYNNKFFSNVTNYQLADGLDSFYSDYRNRVISVDGAVWLVVNEISGKSDAEMQTMIENWRRGAGTRQ